VRRTASILLLGILLFNWFGYELVTSYMQRKADVQFKARLDDNNFDESQLISVKVPATNLGYYANTSSFERVDGIVEINGIQYNYVKRRVFNDSVEMLCIPNHTAMQLKDAKNEFFKLVNDLQNPAQGKKSDSHQGSSYKSFSIDYYTVNNQFDMSNLYFTTTERAAHYIFYVPSFFALVSEQPPDIC
jgi:hypothetical protein